MSKRKNKKNKKDYNVREISKKEAGELIKKYHYLGGSGFMYRKAYGLFYKGDLVGAAVFHGVSSPLIAKGMLGFPPNQQEGMWELGRFVLHPDFNGDNNATWFLSRAIHKLRSTENVKLLLSYADSSLHDGKMYQAFGFKYYGLTAKKTDFYEEVVDVFGNVYYKKKNRGKTRGVKGVWKPRPRKHRYLKIYYRPWRKRLRWKEQPYPKDEK